MWLIKAHVYLKGIAIINSKTVRQSDFFDFKLSPRLNLIFKSTRVVGEFLNNQKYKINLN